MRELLKGKNLVLIGFMGTGKTSVGRRLALRLGREFKDSDLEIERLTGMSVAQIFERYDELRFRSEERLVIAKLAGQQGLVIATGGGAVLNPENLADLRRSGVLVTLTASPEVISTRTSRKGTRPLLRKDNSPAAVAKLLQEREFAYSQGDIIIDTSNLDIEQAADSIMRALEETGYGQG